jgi:hypothetical protein
MTKIDGRGRTHDWLTNLAKAVSNRPAQPAAEIRSAPRPALSSACAEGDEASRAAGLDGEWLLPAQIVTERFGRDGKWVTEYAVLGSNLVEMCRCKDEQTARYIVCAVNQMPRVSIAKGAL